MDKKSFLLAAMKAECFRRRPWLIAALSLIQEEPNAYLKDPYPYRIVHTPSGYFFVDPENELKLTEIKGCEVGKPIFSVRDHIDLKKGDLPNLHKDISECVGNIIYNWVVICWALNGKIPFMEGKIKTSMTEKFILEKLTDNPPEGKERSQDKIYIDEYLQFVDATFFLTCLTQICVPAGTPKSLVAAPGIHEYRNKLLAEQPDRHTDPAFVAEVDAKLVAYDREYLKNDRSSDFYINNKSFDIVRKKLFGMHGAEKGIEENVGIKLIPNSLSEGWDVDYFAAMNDSLRTGSFNRGFQTMLGGESVKWLLRASSNVSIKEDDCETNTGITRAVTKDNYKTFIGFHAVVGNKSVELTSDNVSQLVGKDAVIRSPAYCKTARRVPNGYCKVCCGPKLANNVTGLSTAVSEYGSAFLAMYMSAAHAKATKLATVDLDTAFT